MPLSIDLANRFREVALNGTFIANTNFKHQISDVTCEEANTKVHSLNTIAALTFHIGYYLGGVNQAFQGGPLDIRDQYSFDFIPPATDEEWNAMRQKFLESAELFAHLVEKMPDSLLSEPFVNEKYGSYHRNIDAMIEHCYYHLGQITLLKKIIRLWWV
jgi:uncharacterized damage-inducible protein DinB